MASASANSLRTLARPTIPLASRIQPIVLSAASFSTTHGLALPAAAKNRKDLPKAGKKNFKKKSQIQAVKKPNPGERKAFRKRIQLSNNGALPVEGLGTLEAGTMRDSANSGKVFALSDALVDQLRVLEAFKTTQQWNLFRKPHVLLRKETVEVMKLLDEAATKKELKQYVLTGSKLSGKSMMLLQALGHALMNNWVVIHVPEGQDLTNGNTEYTPVPDTQPVEFVQPTYALKLVQAIYKANKSVLEALKIEKESSRVGGLKEGATLADLLSNAKEADAAWPALQALWAELTLPGRPPVLFTLDGLSHINKISAYRDPAFNEVHSHDLLLVRMFTDALSGKTKFPNGGMVLAATSESNTNRHPSQELVISQLEAGQAGREIPKPEPYERGYDNRVYDAIKNSRIIRLEGATQDEVRALMEYWGASGLVRSVLNSHIVAEKWSLAGHGNIGELERASLMTMRM